MGAPARMLPLVVAWLVAAPLLAWAPTASAETWSTSNQAGDGGPRIDISALRVDNRDHAVALRIRFRHPRMARIGAFSSIIDIGPAKGRGLHVEGRWRRAAHRFETRLTVIEIESDAPPRERDCPGLRVQWQQRRSSHRYLAVRLPRACMKNTGDRVRVSVRVAKRPRSAHDDAAPRRFSPWIDRGERSADR
jgi:hypothetical protein